MNTIRIRKQINSDILHLPGLLPLIGHTVEIVIQQVPQAVPAAENDWRPIFDLAGKDLIDPEAYKELRAASMI
jgi:hypothetical protein